ncbi:MAG TPA: ABC transporter permease [Dehalococcoidales bacterium]
MKQLKHIWFIALKDLRLFLTDRLALFFFILFPFLFVIVFNFMLQGIGSQDPRLELHLVTQEVAGGLSHQIISAMETKDEGQLKPGEPLIIWDNDYNEARQAVEAKKLAGFLAFPADFTQGVMMGYGTKLEVVVDPAETYIRAALNGLASAIASQIGSQQLATNAAVSLLVEEKLTSGDMSSLGGEIQKLLTASPAATSPPLITSETEKMGEVEAWNPANYVIPGYLVMFTFFAAAQSASIIVRERQNNTLERLLSSSVRREILLAGMFTGTMAKGLIQIAIFWLAGLLIFRIDLGLSPAAVIILSILMVIMSAAFSIMLATLAKTQRSADALGTLLSLVLAPLGGCWWPLFITPQWMQFIAKITPHGWANTGFNELMVFGGNFSGAVPNMLALAGFAVVFGTIAIMRFRTSAT